MKKYLLLMSLALWANLLFARTGSSNTFLPIPPQGVSAHLPLKMDTPTGLKLGAAVPDITIDNVTDFSKPTVKLSDFHGKLLILDFWATWCSPCVGMIPRMDSLQKEFAGKMQFLPIRYQDEKVVTAFIQKFKERHPFNLPDGAANPKLLALFPHTSLPHYVWISPDGTLLAITGYEEVTAANIRKVLSRKLTTLLLKQDEQPAIYDQEKLLLGGSNGGNEDLINYRTILTAYLPGIHAGYEVFGLDGNQPLRILAKNLPLATLFSLSHFHDGYFGPRKTVFEVKDAGQLKSDESAIGYESWYKKHSYCYELLVPDNLRGQAFDIMQQDLKRLFPDYVCTLEKRVTTCIALVCSGDTNKFKSNGGEYQVTINGAGCHLQNARLERLTEQLDALYMQGGKMPVVDATNFNGLADIDLNCPLNDLKSLNTALAAYDLKLVQTQFPIDFLVIRDTSSATPQINEPSISKP